MTWRRALAMIRRSRTILVWFERRHGFQNGNTVQQYSKEGSRLLTRCVVVKADEAWAVYYGDQLLCLIYNEAVGNEKKEK